jgi:hypothetical protein
MDWLLYLVAALFVLAGAACLALIVVSLPGTWIMLGLATAVELLDRFYLPPGADATFGWWLLGLAAAMAALGEVIELLAGAAGARGGGASARGMWGALIGGILGVLLLTPVLLFIPVIGSLVGAVLGTFIGAVVGEMSGTRDGRGAPGQSVRGSFRESLLPATGATIGRVVGTLTKLGIGIAVWLVLSVAAFWP